MPPLVRPQSFIVGRLFGRHASHPWIIEPQTASLLASASFRYHTSEVSRAAPLRKQLKDEAKRKKKLAKAVGASNGQIDAVKDSSADWELTVGIEVHAELNTAYKLFSQACTSVSADPNSHVAKFDAALPGAQPVFQKATLIPALRAALALNCEIQPKSSWDRKHYFYQDQPNGYQITQYYGRCSVLLTNAVSS